MALSTVASATSVYLDGRVAYAISGTATITTIEGPWHDGQWFELFSVDGFNFGSGGNVSVSVTTTVAAGKSVVVNVKDDLFVPQKSGVPVHAGQTDYNTGTGFFLGDLAGTAKLSVGNPAANNMTWDGTNLNVSGSLTATTGTIGGFTIGASSLTAGTGATRVGMSTGDGFYCGSNTPGSAPFNVTPAGALEATNATITGALSATSLSVTDNVGITWSSGGSTTSVIGIAGSVLNVSVDGNSAISIGVNSVEPAGDLKLAATKVLKVNNTQVVGARGAAVADATGAGDVVAQLNALLARLRAHGLIAS